MTDEIDRGRLVARLLGMASREGLDGARLEALGRGLAERADSISRDRDRLSRLTEERDWLKQTVAGQEHQIASLERERGWLVDTVAERDEEKRGLEEMHAAAERAWTGERDAFGEQHRKASEAHDVLLDHHRRLLGRLASEMRDVMRTPRWSGEVRRRLAELAELLERELS